MAVIYLDPDDEITTAVARIRAAADPGVALVLPPGSRLGTSRINFRLLAREARESGRRVSIVTGEAGVRALAVSAAMPAYGTVGEYEAAVASGDGEPTEAPTSPPPLDAAPNPNDPTEPLATRAQPAPAGLRRPRAEASAGRPSRALAIVLLVVLAGAVTGAGALVVLPSAAITVTPKVETIGPLTLIFVADPAAIRPDPATGVPAQLVELPLTAERTFEATGVKVTETRSSGTVTFSNLDTGRRNTIDAGSLVSTDSNVRFRTLDAITIPKARIIGGLTIEPGRKSVKVEAVNAGEAGNVAANAIDNVPSGEDPIVLKVTNPAPTGGGTHTESKSILQADVDGAVVALTTDLEAALAAGLADPATAPAGTSLVGATASLGTVTSAPSPDELVGREVETFDLALSATASVIAVDSSVIEPLSRKAVEAAVGAPRELFPDSIAVTVGAPTVGDGIVRYAVSATGRAWLPLDAAELLASVKGLPVAQARAALARYGDVRIETWPGFVDTIPTFGDRASLVVLVPGPSGAP